MPTPEEIRENMRRLSRIDEKLKIGSSSTPARVWTPGGIIDKPVGWKDGLLPRQPQVKVGPRGGRYTEEVTRDGRRYRRYF